jgi:flagellar M-ring protein FliF
MLALAGSIGRHVGVVLLGLLILFLVVRPAMKQINAQTPKPALVNQAINNEVGLPPPGNTAPAGLSNAEVLRLAREDPAMVANVVRTWVNKDG